MLPQYPKGRGGARKAVVFCDDPEPTLWMRCCARPGHRPTLAYALSALLFALATFSAVAAEPKRVLVIHSFGSAAPPFTTHSTAFEAALTSEMGERVDLDEVSLDVARYADVDMQEALVDYLRKRQTKWQPDLVVPIGSPAAIFVAQFRDRLFPHTPIVYCGLDRRRLPPDALEKNATFIGTIYEIPAFVEDILQVAPATTNIAVVIGASPLEQYWMAAFQRDFAVFTNRVHFTWLNDLSFDHMLDRLSKLPPRSFVFLILLLRDATGVTHNADEALQRIHAVANAPVNGIFQHQLGLGVVGGRLYQAELEGVESAHIAVRILRGEPASSFAPRMMKPLQPRYDWRELQRWHMSEDRLPPGSTVLFRRPTAWERSKWRIIGVGALVVLQAVVIFILLANLIKRRRAERSLAESEARFRVAADGAPVMIWMAGTDKLCTFFNKAWLEFTGRTVEQELGNGWTDGIHPDDVAGCLKIYQESFDARREFTMEYRMRRPHGDYAWVLDTGTPRFSGDGTFAGYVGSATEITEIKHAQERLRSVVEGAPNAMLVVDANGKITLVNARTEAVFGYTRTELIGNAVERVLPEVFRGPHQVPGRTYAENPTPITLGAEQGLFGRRKDGSRVPLEIGLNPIRTPEGQFVLASIVDITERLAAEAKLRESEKRMTMAADAAHLGMWVWDAPETHIWTSARWKAIYGYAPDENIRFDALIERVHPEDRDAVGRIVTEAFSNQSSFFVEHRVMLPDGKVRWISTSGRVEQTANNGPLRLLGISIDITGRKDAEEAAREISGKLITAQEDERRRIARDLHDDLNQRLALLSVEADLLGRMDHNPAAQPLIEGIASTVRSLSSEVHKLSYQLHPAKLEQLGLIAATRSFCHELSKQVGMPVEFVHDDVPRDLPPNLALCLYRIVQEGLQNVVKHSHATRARVEVKREGDEIHLLISDNGQGFDTTRARSHAGLGLVGMRERIRLVRGDISFHSAPGQGTRIEVLVPIGLSQTAA